MQDTFNWRAQWYPVAVVNDLDPSRPHATKLLGQGNLLILASVMPGFTALRDSPNFAAGDDYVLMRDADKVWRCLEDKCSHRYPCFPSHPDLQL